MEQTLAHYLPHLRPAQRRSLALWVYGTILAQSACQNAVITTLLAVGRWHALRQRLREWLYDGEDKAAPCLTQLDVSRGFAPLLRWVLTWWQGTELALAIDATAHGERVVVLVVSVLYRGSALPVAWHVWPANQPGAWMPPIVRVLGQLRATVPQTLGVLVLADRGLWSPRLWQRIRALHWHPMLRLQDTASFQPLGQPRQRVRELVPGPGHAWVGRGVAFRARRLRRPGTLVVVWTMDQATPWVVLTDVPPERVGVCWYELRVWSEVCQTQPVKMPWWPLRRAPWTISDPRGSFKREHGGDIDLLGCHHPFADQAVRHCLARFKREPVQIGPQQLPKGGGMLNDLLPMPRLVLRTVSLLACLGDLLYLGKEFPPSSLPFIQADHLGLIGIQ